jgi:hypothetical protein
MQILPAHWWRPQAQGGPCGPDDPDTIYSVQSNAEYKDGVQHDASARPDAERCLDVLVVEL